MIDNLRRGIRIRKHQGSESIQVAFSYLGQECRETLKHVRPNKSGLAEAARRLDRIRKAIADGDFDYGAEFPDSKRARVIQGPGVAMTVGELLDEYLSVHKERLAPSTYAAYRSMVDRQLKPGLGEDRVRELSAPKIRGWLASSAMWGRSRKYARNIVSPLRLAYDYAAFKRYVTGNPVPEALKFTNIQTLVDTGGNQAHPLNSTEIGELLAACANPGVRNMFRFAFETGLRISELIALRWNHVSLENRTASVIQARVLNKTKGTKTRKGTRVVDLSEMAVKALEDQRELYKADGTIFRHPSSGLAVRSSHDVYMFWRDAIEKTSIQYRSPRQTRHTFASMKISSGINLFYLAEQMGHTGLEMLIKHYGKFIRKNKQTSAQMDRDFDPSAIPTHPEEATRGKTP